MATGDSGNILSRVLRLIPSRWFASAAPIRDAIAGGISDGMAWAYSLIGWARLQSRVATATGPFLDLVALDFFGRNLRRRAGQSDAAFRARIQAELLRERVTRAGMARALTDLTGHAPVIFEPWNAGDSLAWDTPPFAWDATGGWGDTCLPSQSFLVAYRSGSQGVPRVAGWDTAPAAWDGGHLEWIDPSMIEGAVTDEDILNAIRRTKPTGSVVWTVLQ